MKTLASRIRRFLTSEDGPTAVEYAVMLALIIVVCIVIIQSLGRNISSTFGTVSSALGGTTSGS
ncbi:MAG: Flp family type IVb pilin [Isosphaeraceae bacterium]|nr:Flp family type IVb pilin [Isosphaeraceae bacterium]